MNATTTAPSVLLITAFVFAGCTSQATSTSSAAPETESLVPTSETSLLPDGIWEAEIVAEAMVAAGGSGDDAGVYRWTFDGSRARITVNGGEAGCDADAEPAGDAVRLTYHITHDPEFGCGGFDTIRWAVEGDGLHLTLVETNGDYAATKAILEAMPYQPIDGDRTLSWPDAAD